MAGGPRARAKINVLLGGASLVVDVSSGAGTEKVKTEILKRLSSGNANGAYIGGKVPRKFIELNRIFSEVTRKTVR